MLCCICNKEMTDTSIQVVCKGKSSFAHIKCLSKKEEQGFTLEKGEKTNEPQD